LGENYRILANNFNALNDALKHFIKGKIIASQEQKETWLDEINILINGGEGTRSGLYKNFVSNEDVF